MGTSVRRSRGACAAIAALPVVAFLALGAGGAQAASKTFSFTGDQQAFTVPNGVTSVHAVLVGGRGGTGASSSSNGGFGARATGDIPVTPGQGLFIFVGGNGANGSTGTGGNGGVHGGA